MSGNRAADLTAITLQPGVYTNTSDRTAVGRWKDSNRIRFHKGLPEKIGGSQVLPLTNADGDNVTYRGEARARLDWSSLDNQKWIGFGTEKKLYLVNNGRLYDITPLRKTSSVTDPFTTLNTSAIVTVTDVDHRANEGDFIRIFSADTVGGLDLEGEYEITSITGPDTYTIDAGTASSGDATGGGDVTIEYDINSGLASNGELLGYGTGNYGEGTYGTPRQTGSGVMAKMRTWSLQQWGEDMVANPRGGPIYWWDRSTGPNSRAVVIQNAPAACERILVNPENQILIAVGSTTALGTPDKMNLRWTAQSDLNDWTASATNTAGGKRLDRGSSLVTADQSSSANLVWSNTQLYAMEFVDLPLVFGFRPLGTCSIVGPNAAADANGVEFFMGFDDFFVYDGTLRVLPCDVWTRVFKDFDKTQAEKVFCSYYPTKSEVRWDYPSRSSGTGENDRYVVYNYGEQVWYYGDMQRTAYGATPQALDEDMTSPYAFWNGEFYQQEVGTDEIDIDGVAVAQDWRLESWDIVMGGSDKVMLVNGVVPDFDHMYAGIMMDLMLKAYPRQQNYVTKSYTIAEGEQNLTVRAKASQIAMRFYGTAALGCDVRFGTFQALVTPYGGRMGQRAYVASAPEPPVLSGLLIDSTTIVEEVAVIQHDGHLSWTEAIVDNSSIVNYRLWRSVNGGPYALLATTPAHIRDYVDEALVEGSVYDYYVIADATNGESSDTSNGVQLAPEASEQDGELFLHAYAVLTFRSQANGTYAANGPWSSGGVVSSEEAGFDPGLDMYPMLCYEAGIGPTDMIATFSGTYNGSPVTRQVTLPGDTRYIIDETQPFHEITSVQITQSHSGADGFMTAGVSIRTITSTSGFDAVTFYGGIDASLQLTVSGTPRDIHGPLSDPSTGTPIDFVALGFTGVTLFIVKTANTAERTVDLQGTPDDESLVLPVGSGTSIDGVTEFESLDAVVVTAGTSSAPFAAIGARYRAPE